MVPIPDGGALFKLGSAIAKPLLSAWWKRQQELQTVAGQTRELANSVHTLREAELRFESLGNSLVRELQQTIGEARVDDGERESVILAAAEAYASTGLDAERLAALSNDPRRLAAEVRSRRPDATRLFSADGEALYERLIDEACRRLVVIVRAIPEFGWATDHEILSRLDRMPGEVREILREFRESEMASRLTNDDLTAARFETDYREAVALNLDWLELYGVDRLSPHSRSQRLTVAFVSLQCATGAPARFLSEVDGPPDLYLG